MIKTLSVLTALMAGAGMGRSEEAATLAPQAPAWLEDYASALRKGRRETKPLVVVIGSGEAGWHQVSEEGRLGKEANRLLADQYVCLYVDTDKEGGQQLASAFEVSDGPGIVISDPSGEMQAFRHEGELSNGQLTQYLRKFADPDQAAEFTETPSAARVSNYQPAEAPPVFAPPVNFARPAAGCSS